MAMTAADALWLDNFNEYRAANGLQPVAYDEALDLSAKNHSEEVLATDQFNHSDNLFQDIADAGFQFQDGNNNGFYEYTILENHGYGADDGASDTALVLRQQAGYESSPSHDAAMKDPNIELIGLDMTKGNFQGTDVVFSTMHMVAQERAPIVMGTVINDADADRDYDIGEGLGGRTVTMTSSTGQVFTTTTNDTGYYDFENLAPGAYTLKTGNTAPQTINVTDKNVEVNFYNPDAAPANQTITGTQGANNLVGGDGNDSISGIGGNDTITGGAGDDQLSGGAGADNFVFYAGFGHDTIVDFTAKGNGHDTITFDDSTGLTNFGEVISHARQVGGSLVIVEPATGDVLELPHTKLSDLSSGDFLFV